MKPSDSFEEYLLADGTAARRRDVEVMHREGGAVLRHQAAGYFQLSPLGVLIWDQLDEPRQLRALVLALLHEHEVFAPDHCVTLLKSLHSAGWLEVEVEIPVAERANRIRNALEWRTEWSGADAAISALYPAGRLLFHPASLAILLTVTFIGFGLFLAYFQELAAVAGRASLGKIVAAGWSVTVASIGLHELAHALTVKHYGRVVRSMGVGWYWFGPMAFVDTSDMWLGTRRERIAVSLAGPMVNGILGGLATIAALAASGDAAAFFALVATSNWVLAFSNLNPAMEYDGYFILTELLRVPNLRPEALEWLGAAILNRPSAQEVREHRVELAYATLTVAFVITSIFVVFAMSDMLADWLAPFIGAAFAQSVAQMGAAFLSLLAALALAGDLWPKRTPQRRGATMP